MDQRTLKRLAIWITCDLKFTKPSSQYVKKKLPLAACTYCGAPVRQRYFTDDMVFECTNQDCTAQFFPEHYELVKQ